MESRQRLKTANAVELYEVEAKLDCDHASQLANLRAELSERILSDLVANKEGLASDLQHEGLVSTKYTRRFLQVSTELPKFHFARHVSTRRGSTRRARLARHAT